MIKTVLNRPITVIMFFVAVLFIGTISILRLPLELKPNTEYPSLTIYCNWPNTSPETIEGKVTAPIESQISGLNDIHKIRSTSRSGSCSITIEYERDTNMNFAYMNLNEKLAIIKKDLPDEVKRYVRIQKYEVKEFGESDNLLVYKIYGDLKLYQVYQYAIDNIQNKISSINGVSKAEVTGSSGREIKILIDRAKARMYGISPYTINARLTEHGKTFDTGVFKQGPFEFNMMINNRFNKLDEIRNIYLGKRGKVNVYLKNLAEVKDDIGDNYYLDRINGVSTVTLKIEKESGANAIETADNIMAEIARIEAELPENIKLELSEDSTEDMRDQLADVRKRAIISLVIITLVLLVFLRDIKTPLIIVTTIFFSLLLTFIFLYFAGHTINIVTLSGLALGLGLLVDNSIVVIENIYQYYHKGYSKYEASLKGTKEVMMPIITSTFTTCVVFLPFLFISGEKKYTWIPLAIAVSLSLLSSLVVSFTFTPTITNLFLNRHTEAENKITPADLKIHDSFYHSLLQILIRNKVMTILFVGTFFYIAYFMFDKYVDKGEIFKWGRDNTVSVYIRMPTGSKIEMADKIIKNFEKRAKDVGGYKRFTTTVSNSHAQLLVEYTDEDFKSIKPFKMEEELVAMAINFQGPFISVYNPLNSSGSYRAGGTTSKDYSNTVLVKGYSYDELKDQATILQNYLLDNRKIDEVDINGTRGWWSASDMFNFVFKINREKLASFNTTVNDITWFIRSSIGGSLARKLILKSKETDYSVKYSDYKEFNVDQLKDLIYYYGSQFFRLNEVADIEKEPIMKDIYKEDQAYTRYVKFNYRGTSRNAAKFQDELVKNYYLPPGYSFDEPEYSYMKEEEVQEIYRVLLLAIILVFMVTASLFESFWHPFVVILTVPLGLIGVYFIFFFMDESFNQDAYMGAILLAGIAVNNSIILVNHINDLRKEGLDMLTSIVVGTSQRVRPILMTTFTTVIGILPLIINTEKDENFWYSLSITTVGGLIASTIFVLTVVPVFYAAVERIKARFAEYTFKLVKGNDQKASLVEKQKS